MTDNVIPFPIKDEEGFFLAESKEEHLSLCKMVLTEEDYADVLCGIMDPEIYESLDQEIKNIIDTYFEFNL